VNIQHLQTLTFLAFAIGLP